MGRIVLICVLSEVLGLTTACQIKACYYTNDAAERPRRYIVIPLTLNYNLCTHMIYAFANISNNRLKGSLPIDEGSPWIPGIYDGFNGFKILHEKVVTLLSLGGWGSSVVEFVNMLSTPQNRKAFIDHAITFLRHHDFDGLDLHWKFPPAKDGTYWDKTKFSFLIKELKEAFEKESKMFQRRRLVLTAALTGYINTQVNLYDVPEISKYLDFIFIMTYDLSIASKYLKHPSAFYTNDSADLNSSTIIDHYLREGIPKNKLVVGLQMYGRSFGAFSYQNNLKNGITPPSYATKKSNIMAYFEVCQMIQYGWKVGLDRNSPYLHTGNMWVGFEDVNSIREKVRMVMKRGLAGVMYWSVDMDDLNRKWCKQFSKNLLESADEACRSYASSSSLNTTVTSYAPKVIIPYTNPFPTLSRAENFYQLNTSDLFKKCTGVKGIQKLPYPGWPCDRHITCIGRIGSVDTCPHFQIFDPVNKHCQWYHLVPQCFKKEN